MIPIKGARFLEMPGGELSAIQDTDIFVVESAGLTYYVQFSTIKTYALAAGCLDFCVKVTIPTASALLLFTTPILLIPAPGAGYKVIPTNAYLTMTYNSTTYAGNALTIYQNTIGIPIFETNNHLAATDVDCSFLDTSGLQAQVFLANTATYISVPTSNLTVGNSPLIIRTINKLVAV